VILKGKGESKGSPFLYQLVTSLSPPLITPQGGKQFSLREWDFYASLLKENTKNFGYEDEVATNGSTKAIR